MPKAEERHSAPRIELCEVVIDALKEALRVNSLTDFYRLLAPTLAQVGVEAAEEMADSGQRIGEALVRVAWDEQKRFTERMKSARAASTKRWQKWDAKRKANAAQTVSKRKTNAAPTVSKPLANGLQTVSKQLANAAPTVGYAHTETETETDTVSSSSSCKPEEPKMETSASASGSNMTASFSEFDGAVDYAAIADPWNDPVAMTLKACHVNDQRNYNAFAKQHKRLGDRKFRDLLASFVGEISLGECADIDNLAALFTSRLQQVS